MSRQTSIIPALLAAGGALLPVKALACAVCVGWGDGQGLNAGFYWSALFLTALPFAVIAAVGAWVRRTAAGGHREPPSDPSNPGTP
jgi:hypothetical protein